jgi:hypothetical protein
MLSLSPEFSQGGFLLKCGLFDSFSTQRGVMACQGVGCSFS